MSFDIKNLEAKLCITKAVLFLLDNKVLYQIPLTKLKIQQSITFILVSSSKYLTKNTYL